MLHTKRFAVFSLLLMMLVALGTSTTNAQDGGEKKGGDTPPITSDGPNVGSPQPALITTILYDQYTVASGINLVIGTFLDAYHEIAAEFTVPAGGWTITDVQYRMGVVDTLGFSNTVNVTFYNDAAGSVGTVACSRPTQVMNTVSGNERQTTLSTPCTLGAGTYWFSVTPIMACNAATCGTVTSFGLFNPPVGATFAIQRSTTCPAWVPSTSCFFAGMDIPFRLLNISNHALVATAVCDPLNADNLLVTITDGDGPYNITATGSTTPSVPVLGVSEGTHTLVGPDHWQSLTVTELGGDLEVLTVGTGTFNCVNLNGSILIPAGASPSNTVGIADPYPSTFNVSGFGNNLTDVNVNIVGLGHTYTDDLELLLVSPSGTTALIMSDACGDWGGHIYNFTFDDEAAGLLNDNEGCVSGTYQLSNFGTTAFPAPAPAGPYGVNLSVFDGQNPNGTWSLYVRDDVGGDYGDIGSWSLDITANNVLAVTSACNAGSLDVTISNGDSAYTIDYSLDSVAQPTINAPANGTYTLAGDAAGPNAFAFTVSEVGGNGETFSDSVNCNVPVGTTVACAADGGLDITINAGDVPFALTYVLNGVPIPPSIGFPLGLLHLGPALDGPSAFTAIQLEEMSGDSQDAGILDTSCNVPLNTTMACNGDNLDVIINNGDGPFNITGTGNGLPANGVGVGTTTLTGPAAWFGVTVTETDGNGQSQLLGDIACSAGTPGLIINASDNQSGEDGSTATVAVSLATPPLADVTVAYSSSDTTEGTVTGSPLLFTSLNWMTPQVVTVTGVDDLVADGDIAYTIDFGPTSSADATYNGLSSQATITNIDNDSASILVTELETPMETSEAGDTAQFTFVLTSQPTATVTITSDSLNLNEGVVSSGGVLNFDDTNWMTPQTVTVTGVDDLVPDGDVAYDIDWSAGSLDGNYDHVTGVVIVTNLDDDTPEIIITPAAYFTWEEGQPITTYTVELGASPAVGEMVTVDIELVPLQLASQTPVQVVFDETNWNVAVEIDVQPLDDGINENFTIETITHTATSDLLGSAWEGVTADLTLTIFDTQALAFPPSFNIPNTGEIMITLAQTQQPCDGAGGEPIYLPSGAPLLLPHDYDGNGFDTYTVTETQTVAGETWFGIFIGNATWVWVPADGVTVLR